MSVTSPRVETIGDCTLYLGDCREVLPTISRDGTAVVSDPPYGISYVKGGGGKGFGAARNSAPIVGDDEPFDPAPWLEFPEVILWGANHFAARLPHGRWLAWDKLAGVQPFDSFSDVEFAWVKGRGKDRIFSHLWKGVLKGSEKTGGKHQERWHPTQKPIVLMRWCIDQTTAGLVFDPYMGSGTTGVAAVQAGRRFVGCEVDRGYFDVACRRIEEAYRQPKLFEPAVAPSAPAVQGALLLDGGAE